MSNRKYVGVVQDMKFVPLTGIPPLRNPPPPPSAEPPIKKVKHSIFSCINRLFGWIRDRYDEVQGEHTDYLVMSEPI